MQKARYWKSRSVSHAVVFAVVHKNATTATRTDITMIHYFAKKDLDVVRARWSTVENVSKFYKIVFAELWSFVRRRRCRTWRWTVRVHRS